VNWIELSQDREQWRILLNTVMHLRLLRVKRKKFYLLRERKHGRGLPGTTKRNLMGQFCELLYCRQP